MVGTRSIADNIKFKLICNYEEKWKKMAMDIWPDVAINNIAIVHLDCQGYNDCCIWCWIVPMLTQREIDRLGRRGGVELADRLFSKFINS